MSTQQVIFDKSATVMESGSTSLLIASHHFLA